jgi:hypothetical protein
MNSVLIQQYFISAKVPSNSYNVRLWCMITRILTFFPCLFVINHKSSLETTHFQQIREICPPTQKKNHQLQLTEPADMSVLMATNRKIWSLTYKLNASPNHVAQLLPVTLCV